MLAALFLLSLLSFFPSTSLLQMKFRLLATEWGHLLAIAALGAASIKPRRTAVVLGLAASLIFSLPWIQSLKFERDTPLRGELASISGHIFDQAHALKLSVWRDASFKAPQPCVMVVHGGNWTGGNRMEFSSFNGQLAARGITAVSVDYRLAGEARWPAQLEDLLQARKWLEMNSKSLGIDPGRIAILGRSAGAHLALCAAMAHPGLFKGVISYYGPSDMGALRSHPLPGDLVHSAETFKLLFGGAAPADASPLAIAAKNSPPILLIHGAKDSVIPPDQSLQLAIALDQLGHRDHRLLLLPWAEHAFDLNASGPGSLVAHAATFDFLNRIFRR